MRATKSLNPPPPAPHPAPTPAPPPSLPTPPPSAIPILPHPHQLVVGHATYQHYQQLARFHYVQRKPAIAAGIYAVWHKHARQPSSSHLAAVLVVSYPAVRCLAREAALQLPANPAERLDWVNQYVRTISRLIVHPTYRGLGLTRLLIDFAAADQARTGARVLEALASMGSVHPMFERAGMTRLSMQKIRKAKGPQRRSIRPAYFYKMLDPQIPADRSTP